MWWSLKYYIKPINKAEITIITPITSAKPLKNFIAISLLFL